MCNTKANCPWLSSQSNASKLAKELSDFLALVIYNTLTLFDRLYTVHVDPKTKCPSTLKYIYIIYYNFGCTCISSRDTTLPDTGFNQIVIYRILDIPDSSSKFKHKSQRMKWEYYCQCSLQLKFKQNIHVFPLIQIKLEQVWQSTNEGTAHQTSQT